MCVCVCVSGLVQSLVAAACSRVGKKVIHTDSLPFYGGAWSSLTLDDFKDHEKHHKDTQKDTDHFNSQLGIQNVTLWDSGTPPRTSTYLHANKSEKRGARNVLSLQFRIGLG